MSQNLWMIWTKSIYRFRLKAIFPNDTEVISDFYDFMTITLQQNIGEFREICDEYYHIE